MTTSPTLPSSSHLKTEARRHLVGEVLGEYVVVESLGAGPRGETLLARRRDDSRWRVKLLSAPPAVVMASPLRAVLTEARKLQLPRVIVPELVQVGVHAALVERHTETEPTTRARLAGHPVEVARATLQLVRSLEALHAGGQAHGALHANNVRLATGSATTDVVLMDLGADRVGAERWDSTQPATFDDTWRGLAPEQRLGLRGDPRSDFFALGWWLLELVGEAPRSGAFARPPAEPRLAEPWRGKGLEALLARLLDFDPRSRLTELAQCRHALEAALGELAGEAGVDLEDPVEGWTGRLIADPFDPRALPELERLAMAPSRAPRISEALVLASESLNVVEAGDSPPGANERSAEMLGLAGELRVRSPEGRSAALGLFARAARVAPATPLPAGRLELVEQLAGEFSRPDQLAEVLLAAIETAPASAERARLLARLGRLFEVELADPEQALVAFLEALCLEPTRDEHRVAVERLASSRAGAEHEIATRCLRGVAESTGPERLRLVRFLADFCAERAGLADIAAGCFEELVTSDPSDKDAWLGLVKVQRGATAQGVDRWRALGAALYGLARVETGEAAAAAYVEAAEILEKQLHDLPAAREVLQRALKANPAHGAAITALRRIGESMGDPALQADALELELAHAEGPERLALAVEAAQLRAQSGDQMDHALRLLATALGESPHHTLALELQDRWLTAAGRHRELVENLRVQAAIAPTPRGAIEVWERVARVLDDELHDVDAATEAWACLVNLDPGQRRYVEALRERLSARGRWEEVVGLLERYAERGATSDERADVHLERARVFEVQLARPTAARQALREVLRLRPDERDAYAALARIAEAEGELTTAVAELDAWIGAEPEAAAHAELHVRAARLLARQGDVEGALARCARALDLDPMHPGADELVERLLETLGDGPALLLSLERRLEHLGRPTQATAARFVVLASRVAQVALESVGDRERARTAAESVLSFDADHPGARLVLGDLASRDGRPHEARAHLERGRERAGSLGAARLQRFLRVELEALAESGAPAAAITQAAEALLARATVDEDLLEYVSEVVSRHGEPAQARSLAERLVADFGDTLSPVRKAEAWLRVGLAARALGDDAGARLALEDSLHLAPGPRARELLADLADAAGDRERALGEWEQTLRELAATKPEGRADQVRCLLRMSDTAMAHLGDRERALGFLRRANALLPEDRAVLTRQMKLLGELGQWDQVLAVVERLCSLESSPELAARYHRTAARLLVHELGRGAEAIPHYLAAVTAESGIGAELLDEALALVRQRGDTRAEVELLRSAARIAEGSGDRLAAARALDEMSALVASAGDESAAAAALLDAEHLAPAPSRREHLAQLYDRHLGRHSAAAVTLGHRMLSLDGCAKATLLRLERAYATLRADAAAFTLHQALVVAGDTDPERAARYAAIGRRLAAQRRSWPAPEDRACLTHPTLDHGLTELLGALEPALIAASAHPLADLGYPEQMELELAHYPLAIARHLERAAAFLGAAPPPVFVATRDLGGLSFIHGDPPALLLGSAALSADIEPAAAMFLCVRTLAYFQPGFYLRKAIASSEALAPWLVAAGVAVGDVQASALTSEAVEAATTRLRELLTPDETSELARAVSRVAARGAPVLIGPWMEAVDLTFDRHAYVACGDLCLALELVAADSDQTGASAERRTEELTAFAVSPAHLSLRCTLDVTGPGVQRPQDPVTDRAPGG